MALISIWDGYPCSLYKSTNSATLTYHIENFMQVLTWISSTNKESAINNSTCKYCSVAFTWMVTHWGFIQKLQGLKLNQILRTGHQWVTQLFFRQPFILKNNLTCTCKSKIWFIWRNVTRKKNRILRSLIKSHAWFSSSFILWHTK